MRVNKNDKKFSITNLLSDEALNDSEQEETIKNASEPDPFEHSINGTWGLILLMIGFLVGFVALYFHSQIMFDQPTGMEKEILFRNIAAIAAGIIMVVGIILLLSPGTLVMIIGVILIPVIIYLFLKGIMPTLNYLFVFLGFDALFIVLGYVLRLEL